MRPVGCLTVNCRRPGRLPTSLQICETYKCEVRPNAEARLRKNEWPPIVDPDGNAPLPEYWAAKQQPRAGDNNVEETPTETLAFNRSVGPRNRTRPSRNSFHLLRVTGVCQRVSDRRTSCSSIRGAMEASIHARQTFRFMARGHLETSAVERHSLLPRIVS